MTPRLAGKVVLVSGGARGLGAAHVELFAEEGAAVVFGDVLVDEGVALEGSLWQRGLGVRFIRLDVTSPEDWAAAVDLAVHEHGSLTTLVNNAAVFSPEDSQTLTQEVWGRVISVNMEGQWLGMRAALPALLASGNAAVVNVGSVYAEIATPDAIAYHASKGGVRILSKCIALEYAEKGVRINSVVPGMIDTLFAGPSTPAEDVTEARAVPMRRKGRPREVALASLFLASDDASYVTAAEVVVDGGWAAT
jgi:NAD(P)-dependent dehydrogenase (short-subunit alcohol dehydrogenase family)